MSLPILYNPDETNFTHLGRGILKDAIKCKVIEERNGAFELEMEYPTSGALFDLIETDSIIRADAGHRLKDQRFRVKRIKKDDKGMAEIYAQHISYLAQDLALRPQVTITGSADIALRGWANAIIDEHPFTTFSDVTTNASTTLTIDVAQNARQALGGVEGSILQRWGGEYRFDNYRIELLTNRGSRSNTIIAYGRNLTDLNQEENITNTFTSIYPFALYRPLEGNEELITIPEFVVDSEHVSKFPNRRILPIDFSNDFDHEERPTVARLRELATAYITNNDVGVPRVSLRLSFIDLRQAINASHAVHEEINLCDRIKVYFEKLGIEVESQIIRIEWNVLLDRYDSLELGERRTNLSDRINNIERDVNNVERELSDYNRYIVNNLGNTTFFGPNEPIARRIGDVWFRENGGITSVYEWNGLTWERRVNDITSQALRNRIDDEMQRLDEALEGVKSGDLLVNGAIGARHIVANAITGNHIQTNTLEADRLKVGTTIDASNINVINLNANEITSGNINTGQININQYRIDDTAIGTVGNNDIIFRRGVSVASLEGQQERMRIADVSTRIYVMGSAFLTDGEEIEEGLGDGGGIGNRPSQPSPPSAGTRAGFIEFRSNAIMANNMSPRTPSSNANGSNRNIHLQPADRWVTGIPGLTTVGDDRGGGEVRCTYQTNFPGNGAGQIYAPIRARRVTLQGQLLTSSGNNISQTGGNFNNISRHLTVHPNRRISPTNPHSTTAGFSIGHGLVRISSDLAGAELRGLETREIIIANNESTRTISRVSSNGMGTATNNNYHLRRQGSNMISLQTNGVSMNTNPIIGVTWIGRESNSSFAVRTNNTERILVTGSGHITIGSNASQNIVIQRAGVNRIAVNPVNLNLRSANQSRDLQISDSNYNFSNLYNTTTTNSVNTRVGTTGNLFRVSSSEHYKLMIDRDLELDYAKRILDVPASTWFDKSGVEQYAEILTKHGADVNLDQLDADEIGAFEHLRRTGGVIAEDVEKAGLETYVEYHDGKVEGVHYDRLWTLLIPIVKDQSKQIAELTKRLEKLESREQKWTHK